MELVSLLLPVVVCMYISPAQGSCARSLVLSVKMLGNTGPLRGGIQWETIRSFERHVQRLLSACRQWIRYYITWLVTLRMGGYCASRCHIPCIPLLNTTLTTLAFISLMECHLLWHYEALADRSHLNLDISTSQKMIPNKHPFLTRYSCQMSQRSPQWTEHSLDVNSKEQGFLAE